jgi:hypothetical protein
MRELLLVVDAANADEALAQFADDRWIANGMLTITAIRRWTLLLDGTSRS